MVTFVRDTFLFFIRGNFVSVCSTSSDIHCYCARPCSSAESQRVLLEKRNRAIGGGAAFLFSIVHTGASLSAHVVCLFVCYLLCLIIIIIILNT